MSKLLQCLISHAITSETEIELFYPERGFWNYFKIISPTLNMLETIHELKFILWNNFEIISGKFPSTEMKIFWNSFISHVTTTLIIRGTLEMINVWCRSQWNDTKFATFQMRHFLSGVKIAVYRTDVKNVHHKNKKTLKPVFVKKSKTLKTLINK